MVKRSWNISIGKADIQGPKDGQDRRLRLDQGLIRVLLVEDDEDDYVIVRDLLSEIQVWEFYLEWVSNHASALEKAKQNEYDICLMDYRLGGINGIELMREFLQNGFRAPVILLTGAGSHETDIRAMREGASDYLEKGNLSPNSLERAIRYAIEHSRTLTALRESQHQLRALSTKLLETQENDRKLIAQELHDSIGASLTAIRYGLEEKLHRMGEKSTPPEGISLEQIISIVRDTIEETQRISSNLRPSILDDLGILRTISWHCRKFQDVYSGIRIKEQLLVQEEDVPGPLKITIYRILQEALNNISKYSGADTVRLSLSRIKGGLEFSVEDNGKGFNTEEVLSSEGHPGGMGIQNMRERTMLSRGSFEILSHKEKGTLVRMFWSLE
jgi:signal transduction histidine kinase